MLSGESRKNEFHAIWVSINKILLPELVEFHEKIVPFKNAI